MLVIAELADVRTYAIVWSSRITGHTADLLEAHGDIVRTISVGVFESLLSDAAQHARAEPWPTLAGYSLMLAGITLTHRTTRTDFFKAMDIFSHLAERHPRNALHFRRWIRRVTFLTRWQPRPICRLAVISAQPSLRSARFAPTPPTSRPTAPW